MAGSYGFFGKLPARGDFVSAGLSRDFVASWDGWLQRVLPPVLAALEESWRDAPVWRFLLPAGLCGRHPMTGVLLPSQDKAGRSFPLTIACTDAGADTASLAAAEAAGRAAITQDLAPEALGQWLTDIETHQSAGEPSGSPLLTTWWIAAEPGGVARQMTLPGLPCFAELVMMLASNDRTKS